MGELARIQADAETVSDPVVVPLGLDDGSTVDIEVKPVRRWRDSGLQALRQGDFGTWAAKCLTEDGHAAWVEADPTIGDIDDFFAAWSQATGQDLGKSPASPRSSTSTRKR